MSGYLWKYFFEDDFEGFHRLLAEAGVAARPYAQRGNTGLNSFTLSVAAGSPEALATSPIHNGRMRGEYNRAPPSFSNITLGKADLNRKDVKGLTLLHHVASSTNINANDYALLLIGHPLIDLYVQDPENGWTALHRAFYFGNISIARAIVEREYQDNLGQGGLGLNAHNVSLIKVKDREGNGPYDILTATIHDRTLRHHGLDIRVRRMSQSDDEDDDIINDGDLEIQRKGFVYPFVNVQGDEVFTFGSNKNITLGLGNEDDRQFPEKISLKRPDHLYRRFFREYVDQKALRAAHYHRTYAERIRSSAWVDKDIGSFPAVIRARPITIQDVQMAKFHSAVITNDPVSNLYLCGHGLGGRLGTGSEKTQFKFTCVEDFGPRRKKIVAVALGQDHTLAVTDQGELFSWGNNQFGQLGQGLSKTNITSEEPNQMVPKQLFGPLKREIIVGAAASRIHSVSHTTHALYTFGKNEGQLGIVDAHAASLELQPIPRRVAASRFSCAIQQVSAIDKATVCLLENHEVHVFANYGIVKLQFPLDGFTNNFLKKSFLATRYDDEPNQICKVTCGGDTICALSTAGEIFAVTVDQRSDLGSSATTSTTNPNKIRAALSNPSRIWSLKKGHMSARDVGVDHDGSIILTTEAGSVWRRLKRASTAGSKSARSLDKQSRVFKFSRVPGLTRVTAVRASGSGAYCAIRQDCDVTKSQINVDPKSIWKETFALLPFRNVLHDDDSGMGAEDAVQRMTTCLLQSHDLEKDVSQVLSLKANQNSSHYDAWICSSISNVRIPIHRFMLAARSRYMMDVLSKYQKNQSFSDELMIISQGDAQSCTITLHGIDFLTLVEFVLYIYTDVFVGFWLHAKHSPSLAYRYRQARLELMKLATKLEMRNLESAVRKMTPAAEACLDKDFELALLDPEFALGGDAKIQLSDAEVLVHSDLLSQRCPFFEGLFQGRTGGMWLANRRNEQLGEDDVIAVDMTHVDLGVFRLVLRYLYADTGEELFDDIVSKDLDDFLDTVVDVLSVANELMLDRLSQVCQSVIGRYVNIRNVCQLLNAIGPSSVPEFKESALEYACLNLEALLTNHLLEELDEELLQDLDLVVRDNQLSSVTGMTEDLILERYPELPDIIQLGRQRKIDAINMQLKIAIADSNLPIGVSFESQEDKQPHAVKPDPRTHHSTSGPTTPTMKPKSPAMEGRSAQLDSISTQRGLSTPQFEALNPGSPGFMSMSVSPGLGKSMLDENARPAEYASGMPATSPPNRGTISPTTVTTTSDASSSSLASRPWVASALSSEKLGMKEIMDQAQASRTSSISLGLVSQSQAEPRGSSSFTGGKLSQKERRKQHQQRQESAPSVTPVQMNLSASPTPKSPWQVVASGGKSPGQPSGSADPMPGQPVKPSTQRAVTTPQLTMRQTVANSSAQGKQKATTEAPQTPTTSRAVSASESPKSTPSARSASSSGPSRPIEIQSIRHQPNPTNEVSPTFHMHQSMADILSQQETEKRVIREAAAKVNLQDIQQEQEFLSWWDNESRRIQEEEAARTASTRGRGKGPGGRSRSRGVRRGKGKEGRANSSAE